MLRSNLFSRRPDLNFASDNASVCDPIILDAIKGANSNAAMPYGNDAMTKKVEAKLSDVFETQTRVFLVATGTAANALALSTMTPSWGTIYCHWESHVYEDECGAPEFFANGAKLLPIKGTACKIDPANLDYHARRGHGDVHMTKPEAATITQATEMGTLYSPAEIQSIHDICQKHGLNLHMDGARFANAIAALNNTPAEMTWKSGVDALSFGATKNGALGVEAVILFDLTKAEEFEYRRKRGGHLFSKMRFLSAQMLAYLDNDLWLKNASHANAMATRLSQGLMGIKGVELNQTAAANIIFPKMPKTMIKGLLDQGFEFYERWGDGEVRLVTAFNTTEQSVDALIKATRDLSA